MRTLDKKYFLISILIGVIAVGAITYQKYTEYISRRLIIPEQFKELQGEETEAGIQGAIEYMNRLRANENGEIPLEMIYAARRRADFLAGQANKSQATLGLEWEELGPDNVGGRTRGFLIDKNNPNRMYAGAVSGGLWISDNGGLTWKKYDDQLETLSISCIIQASNGDIYFGTGESFTSIGGNSPSGGSGFPGEGIWKSTDGGTTFENIVSPSNSNSTSDQWAFINRLAADPSNPDIIYAATESGLYQNTGAGESNWTSILASTTKDIKISNDGQTILVGRSNGASISFNGGQTFTNLSSQPGFSTNSLGRCEVVIAPSDNSYMYVYATNNGSNDLAGIYQSKDGGQNWEVISPTTATDFNPPGTQGRYNLCIAVSPTDKEAIFVGGQLGVFRWAAPGNSSSFSSGWKQIAIAASDWQPGQANGFPIPYYVHADHHGLVFAPSNPNILYCTNDGGVFVSNDINTEDPTFAPINRGYNATQFYSMAASITGEVLGGSQDNGSQYIDYKGNSPQAAQSVTGGDGGYCAISKIRPNIMFTEAVFVVSTGQQSGGLLRRSANYGESFSAASVMYDDNIDCNLNSNGVCNPDGVPDELSPFITVFKLWENLTDSSAKMFLGTNSNVWATVNPLDLVSEPTWFNLTNGNINGAVSAIAYTTAGDNIYIGTNSGRLYRIGGIDSAIYDYDDTATWKETFIPTDTLDIVPPYDSIIPAYYTYDSTWHADSAGITLKQINAFSNYVTDVAVDINDPDHIVVTIAGYSNNPHVYISTNATDSNPTFTSIQGNLPAMPVYSAVIDVADPTNIILGTELGIWTTDNPNGGSTQWVEENANGMARVPTYRVIQEPIVYEPNDIDLSDNCHFIYAATHGRGMFRTRTLTSQACKDGIKVGIAPQIAKEENIGINIYPNPISAKGNINFELVKFSVVTVTIMNLEGKIVQLNRLGKLSAGTHKHIFDVNTLSRGTYIVSVISDEGIYSKKIVVAR